MGVLPVFLHHLSGAVRMKPENMPKADFVVSILLMLFSLWVVAHSLKMPRFEELGANPFSVPGIVPGVLGTIIFILSLAVFIRSLRQKGYRLGLTGETLHGFFQETSIQRMLLTTAICLFYGMVMVGRMNYYLATFAFVLGFLLLFQYRSVENAAACLRLLITSLVQAGLTAAIVGAVFRYLFLVDLP
jgi:putative tricarboxylic transport membrane protein